MKPRGTVRILQRFKGSCVLLNINSTIAYVTAASNQFIRKVYNFYNTYKYGLRTRWKR